MRLVAIIAVALALLAGTAAAQAPSERLELARERFLEGDYEGTIAILSPLLFPTPKFSDDDELNEAQILLGVAYFETGQREAAGEQFEDFILRTEGGVDLDENLFSADVREFYDKKRDKLTKEIAEEKKRRAHAVEMERYLRARESARVLEVQHRDYYVNFIPLGAGQFQNGDRGWGRFFFVSEALLGGASFGLFTAQIMKWGWPPQVPRAEVGEAETLQILQVGTGVLFWGVYIVGVIHALENYEPTIYKERPLLPHEEPPGWDGPPTMSSLRLLPAVGPEGAGLTLSWEF